MLPELGSRAVYESEVKGIEDHELRRQWAAWVWAGDVVS